MLDGLALSVRMRALFLGEEIRGAWSSSRGRPGGLSQSELVPAVSSACRFGTAGWLSQVLPAPWVSWAPVVVTPVPITHLAIDLLKEELKLALGRQSAYETTAWLACVSLP
jgi:hypothetical protein